MEEKKGKDKFRSSMAAILSTPTEIAQASTEEVAENKVSGSAFEARGRLRGGKRSRWTSENSFLTSFRFDTAQAEKIFNEICYDARVSKQEAVRRLLAIGIQEYEKTGKLPDPDEE